MNNFNYGENLRIARQIKGISQEAMSWDLSISQSTYSRIESGKIIPDPLQAAKIEEILGVRPSDPMFLLEELSKDTMVSISGSGLNVKAEVLSGKPPAFIIKTGMAMALSGVACDAVRGACSALQISAHNTLLASSMAALTMILCFFIGKAGLRNSAKAALGLKS